MTPKGRKDDHEKLGWSTMTSFSLESRPHFEKKAMQFDAEIILI